MHTHETPVSIQEKLGITREIAREIDEAVEAARPVNHLTDEPYDPEDPAWKRQVYSRLIPRDALQTVGHRPPSSDTPETAGMPEATAPPAESSQVREPEAPAK